MSPSSLIVKGPRARRAPNRYSPSPTTTTFSTSGTHKSTPNKKKETSTKGRVTPKKEPRTKTTPKKITNQKKKEKKKGAPAITTPSSPKKEKKGRKASTPQHILAPTNTTKQKKEKKKGAITTPPSPMKTRSRKANTPHPTSTMGPNLNICNRWTQAQVDEMKSFLARGPM